MGDLRAGEDLLGEEGFRGGRRPEDGRECVRGVALLLVPAVAAPNEGVGRSLSSFERRSWLLLSVVTEAAPAPAPDGVNERRSRGRPRVRSDSRAGRDGMRGAAAAAELGGQSACRSRLLVLARAFFRGGSCPVCSRLSLTRPVERRFALLCRGRDGDLAPSHAFGTTAAARGSCRGCRNSADDGSFVCLSSRLLAGFVGSRIPADASAGIAGAC